MAHWITDGSIGFSINQNVVTYKDETGVDNVYNCIWQENDGISSGRHYWKIHFPTLDDGAGVGLTSKDHFKEGYACKAIKYLGNLSDGGRLLVSKFGPSPSAGDTIGILASFEGDRLKVYIDCNGKSLGLAFDVPASCFKSVFPLVSFHKSGSATCQKINNIPKISDRALTTFTDIEGDWTLTKFHENGTVAPTACNNSMQYATTKLSHTEINTYSWFVKVVNQMSTCLSRVGTNWKTSFIKSTQMLGPPENMQLERKIANLMEDVKIIEVIDGDLSIKTDSISTTWTRYDATPGAYVGNPFE